MDKIRHKSHLKSLEKFNAWEQKRSILPDATGSLSMLSDLYELIPQDRRWRAVDTSGIVKMRQALSLIKSISNEPSQ
jgi:hypothetical protein